MKLSIAIATLIVAAGAALPAVAAAPGPISAALSNAAATPIETVAERKNTQIQRQQRQRNAARTYRGGASARTYRGGADAWASQPRAGVQQYPGWGNCVKGVGSTARSAFPDWDVC